MICKTFFTDWANMYLLENIDNGLIENVGHQSMFPSKSKAFYNYAQLYVGLLAVVWLSSFL